NKSLSRNFFNLYIIYPPGRASVLPAHQFVLPAHQFVIPAQAGIYGQIKARIYGQTRFLAFICPFKRTLF
ncbi:hypothetical protein, partial [Legionella sp. CNM-4043-24]|uniref:hypothetical protein n=1 Tax=Legionella sp. CNM-4043-24 TaxID=3421646 RepID=UPI00403A84AB